eukprot:CAMPEP_0181317578 /NCGR_PEP_ID=MMETSP1101-20121128/16546_1 /TAXON_ID=46948 /ORGANISM="Rhodomonas abbreviata, Strain Caron Lab Isolate" /LENGTH=389 /DNA_ID=CAMNT_0023424987 /DNA_START=171 /DNA_END=1338 /DNA_ORIENTATION=+
MFRGLDAYTRALDDEHPQTVDLGDGICITVKTVDANHCPGSIMVHISGDFGSRLHTGDFRYDARMHNITNYPMLEDITQLFLDTTFMHPSCHKGKVVTAHLPAHRHAGEGAAVYFVSDCLGQEDILQAVHRRYGEQIVLDMRAPHLLPRKTLQVWQAWLSSVDAMSGVVTADTNAPSRFRVCAARGFRRRLRQHRGMVSEKEARAAEEDGARGVHGASALGDEGTAGMLHTEAAVGAAGTESTAGRGSAAAGSAAGAAATTTASATETPTHVTTAAAPPPPATPPQLAAADAADAVAALAAGSTSTTATPRARAAALLKEPLFIRASTLWFGARSREDDLENGPPPIVRCKKKDMLQDRNGIWHVLWSMHSSYPEILALIDHLRPNRVF